MFGNSQYLHMADGRLRIKLAELRRSPGRASRIESELRAVKGVKKVNANPLTGNLLVLFEPGKMSHQRIINRLRQMGYFKSSHSSGARGGADSGLVKALCEIIVQVVIEAALRRLMLAII